MSINKLLSKEWTSCPSELSDIRETVKRICINLGYSEQDANCLVLAIDEACSNIIRYAYENCRDGTIQIDIFIENQQTVFRLHDFAKKVSKDCIKVKQTSPMSPGGLGVDLIHKVMDSVEFIPTKDCVGNLFQLKKNLPMEANKNEF